MKTKIFFGLLMLVGFVGLIRAANEKRTQLSFQVAKSDMTLQQVASLTENMVGNVVAEQQTISTGGWTAINLKPLTNTMDLICVINTDTTNFVQLALSTGTNIFAKLTPGRVAFFPPDPALSNIVARADTSNCVVQVIVAEP